MHVDEMEILWAVSARLDENTTFVLTYQYHTEKDPDDPAGQRNLKRASRYRMLGRVERTADLEAKMSDLRKDENRLGDWRWPGDPSWDGKILYMKDSDNRGRSNWIRLKLAKALPWETAVKVMNGYKKDTDKDSPTYGQYAKLSPSAVRDVKGYSCSDGTVVDVDDREALLGKVGQNVWKEIEMKLVGPKG